MKYEIKYFSDKKPFTAIFKKTWSQIEIGFFSQYLLSGTKKG